jgi:hypothetical protein
MANGNALNAEIMDVDKRVLRCYVTEKGASIADKLIDLHELSSSYSNAMPSLLKTLY